MSENSITVKPGQIYEVVELIGLLGRDRSMIINQLEPKELILVIRQSTYPHLPPTKAISWDRWWEVTHWGKLGLVNEYILRNYCRPIR